MTTPGDTADRRGDGPDDRDRRPSLTSRLALAMALVAVVSAVLAGVLADPLLRSATDDAVRRPLGSQAELLARLPRSALFANRVSAITSAQDRLIAPVPRTGRAPGWTQTASGASTHSRVMVSRSPLSIAS